MNVDNLVAAIRDTEEKFEPKINRDPRVKKWLDTKAARRQVFGKHYNCRPHQSSRPPHDYGIEVTDNGIPIAKNWRNENAERRIYLASGFNRPRFGKQLRKRNGRVEWGADRDAWQKPYVEGKGSRVYMKQQESWWEEAAEVLIEPT
jgi:hypothetical protein